MDSCILSLSSGNGCTMIKLLSSYKMKHSIFSLAADCYDCMYGLKPAPIFFCCVRNTFILIIAFTDWASNTLPTGYR